MKPSRQAGAISFYRLLRSLQHANFIWAIIFGVLFALFFLGLILFEDLSAESRI